jgi:hypothetical protein
MRATDIRFFSSVDFARRAYGRPLRSPDVLSRRLNDAMKSPVAGKRLLAFAPQSPPQNDRQLLLFATILVATILVKPHSAIVAHLTKV